MKKQKGISLIVLIITIVVIIILAASIILNLSKTNIIGNANTAVLKSDISTLQSELELYISDKYVDVKGEYDRIKLNADQTSATYGTEKIEDKNGDGSSNIYDILSSLKSSKLENVVYIQEGELVFKDVGLTDKEKEIILEMGLEVDGMPKVIGIDTNSTYTSIEVSLNITLAEEVEKYVYVLNDGEREESTELTKTYTGLNAGVNYTLEVILVLKDGTEISKKEIISTKSIEGEIKYTKSEDDWTKEDVTVTLTYSEETIPDGYELQYRTKDADGNIIQDWTTYTTAVLVTTNNTSVIGRLYNETLQDEKVGSSTLVSKIDKDVPTVPTTLTLTATEDSITAVADGSTDVGSGIDKYMYSIDNTTWQESGKFTGLEEITEYTVYAKALDKAKNESEVLDGEAKTSEMYEVAFDNTNGNENVTVNGGEFSYNNPVVPAGFKAITTFTASWSDADNDGVIDGWNDGLVIADENDNEFVWVPVDGTNVTYAKWCVGQKISYTATTDDTLPTNVSDEQEQITKYSGFYIGRYEAGVPENQSEIDSSSTTTSDTEGLPVCKKSALVWRYISYTNAKNNAEQMYSNENVQSGLITGKMWDTATKWIKNSGIDTTDSRSYGNYPDSISPANITGYGSISSVAGYSKYWKLKNIYDLAGNAFEWNNEICTSYSNSRAVRAGIYAPGGGGATYTLETRSYNYTYQSFDHIGFRVVLYVM